MISSSEFDLRNLKHGGDHTLSLQAIELKQQSESCFLDYNKLLGFISETPCSETLNPKPFTLVGWLLFQELAM
jgi:hypothetical protein